MRTSFLKALRQGPLFAQLDLENTDGVARLFKSDICGAGDVLAQQGQPGLGAYLVESGEPYDATVTAVRDSSILYLTKDAFDRLLDERPSLLDQLQLRSDTERGPRGRCSRWQEPDETVVLYLHKHRAVLVRALLLPSFALLAFAVAALDPHLLPPELRITAALLALIPLGAIAYLVGDHFNDNYVGTNRRVLHEERIFAIREHCTETWLDMIRDIHQTQTGLLAHIFNYGDLIIETAGESGQVGFRQVPNPDQARNAIFAALDRVRSIARFEHGAAIRSALSASSALRPRRTRMTLRNRRVLGKGRRPVQSGGRPCCGARWPSCCRRYAMRRGIR